MSSFRALTPSTDEDKLLVRHILDLAYQSQKCGYARFSAFLDERQLALCESALISEHISSFASAGGYDDASRRMLVFLPYDECEFEAPFKAVVFNYREQDKPSHRDFLGSLMALEIKRELIGDILVGNKRTVVFVHNTALSLVNDMTKIGKCGVKISYDFDLTDIPEPEFDEIKSTVASIRLDAVLALALRTSREKAQDVIKAKGVTLNRVMTYNPSERLNEGDTFSVRGQGKFVLAEIGGQSKKDRIFITIKKFK